MGMMNIKHARKTETFIVDDLAITVQAYGKTWKGNPAGFSVKILGTEAEYHLNVLEIDEAIFRGLHKYLSRELGLADTTTFLNVPGSRKPNTMWIHADDGRFGFSQHPGMVYKLKEISFSRGPENTRVWEIRRVHIGTTLQGRIVRFGESEDDPLYYAYKGDYFEPHNPDMHSDKDPYLAAAKLLNGPKLSGDDLDAAMKMQI